MKLSYNIKKRYKIYCNVKLSNHNNSNSTQYNFKHPPLNMSKMSSVVGLTKEGSLAKVADDYRAHLMYYVSCASSCIGIEDIPSSRLIRFMDYGRFSLNLGETEELITLCIKFSPYRLKDKCFFLDEKLCKDGGNAFYDADAKFSVAESANISGKMRKIGSVMAYSEKWVFICWENPMKTAVPTFKGY